MKILFFMSLTGNFNLFESAIRLLAERGHTIHISFEAISYEKEGFEFNTRSIEQLAKEHPNITYGQTPMRDDSWRFVSKLIRYTMDYYKFQQPIYDEHPKFKSFLERKIPLPSLIKTILGMIGNSFIGREPILKCLKTIEKAVPTDRRIDQFIKAQDPDIILVTPLIFMGSHQDDYLKSANSAGIKNVMCLLSWDNLINKGLIRIEPDAVIVWNDVLKSEAINLHGVPASKVIVTGASCFDKWFDRKPSISKEAFFQKVGLAPEYPFILYLGSIFLSDEGRSEPGFVKAWIKSIKGSTDPKLNKVGILVRPHPLSRRFEEWEEVDFSAFENVVIWPRVGAFVVDEESRSDFFDSLYYSSAVVGVNTTALIEAAVVGRPVYTIRSPEFKDTQEQVIHGHYLEDGGVLHISDDFQKHLHQLSMLLNKNQYSKGKMREFVKNFVRPYGLNTPSSKIFADSIETLGRSGPKLSEPTSVWVYFLRTMLLPLLAVGALIKKVKKRG